MITISRMDGKKNIGTVRSRKPDGTVMEAGRDGHVPVTVSGQKRKIYCNINKRLFKYFISVNTEIFYKKK